MNYMITGMTGTIAPFIAKELQQQEDSPCLRILGLSRDEFKQSRLKCDAIDDLHLCDIRDYEQLKRVNDVGVHTLIHTAALKHVDLMERFPEECIKTNIMGTLNLCRLQKEGVIGKIVFLSTDKAVQPINVYGMSKGISEKLILNNDPNNLVIRYGNVFNSRGSFVEKLIQQYKANEMNVTLTHKDMTRFWIKIEDAAKFIVEKIVSNDSGIHIPKMKASKITDLIECVQIWGASDKHFSVEETGLRLGEKIHEQLKYKGEFIENMPEEEEMVSNDPSLQMTRAELLEMVATLF